MEHIESKYLNGSLNIFSLFSTFKYKIKFSKEHPTYFQPDGLIIFCGPQGSGKTISAVQYVRKLMRIYPKALLCTNVEIFDLTPSEKMRTIEYQGIQSLSELENGENGIIYFIDEIHLEWNSLESSNISIEEMTEFAQQRKQRKHIVGTSQIYGRMAKPIREQIKNIVLCKNYFGMIQNNMLIDGFSAVENDGKITSEVKKHFLWFHSPQLYNSYDTYAKMKRYKKEWKGRKVSEINATRTIYDNN